MGTLKFIEKGKIILENLKVQYFRGVHEVAVC